MKIPRLKRGGQTQAAKDEYNHDMVQFANALIAEQEKIDFKIGTRGWCYHLEGQNLITKGEFDDAVTAITRLRKSGLLPVDFSAEDIKRKAVNVIKQDGDVDSQLRIWKYSMFENIDSYVPTMLSDHSEVYMEVMVEKTDLVGLFKPICEMYQMPITNIGGNADINSRVSAMRRCADERRKGKKVVILYCGDHDPSGLQISGNLKANFKALDKAAGIKSGFIQIDVFGLTYEYIMENNLVWVDNLDTGSSKKSKIGLDSPEHVDHYKPYVQDYLKKYGARKVEANALLKDIPKARQLLEDNVIHYIGDTALSEYEESLIKSRVDLREAFTKVWGEE